MTVYNHIFKVESSDVIIKYLNKNEKEKKMKKTLTILLTALLLLSGCSSKPANMSDEFYNGGIKALEIIDSYLDFSTSKSSAKSQLSAIKDRFGDLSDIDKHEDYMIKLYVMGLVNDLSGISKADADEILEDRNKLAEALNKKKR